MGRVDMLPLIGAALIYAPAHAQATPAAPSPLDLPTCTDAIMPDGYNVAVSLPAVGLERTIEVGEQLYISNQLVVHEGSLRFNANLTFTGQRNGQSFAVAVPAETLTGGDIDAYARHFTTGVSYRLPNATIRYTGKDGQLGAPSNAVFWLASASDHTTLHGDLKLGSSIYQFDMPNAPMTRLMCTRTPSDSLQREIIYNGVVKGVVTFQYREFVGGVARPAFSQEGTFDLSAGNEIAFKGVHLKVLSASNTGIHYVVTEKPAE